MPCCTGGTGATGATGADGGIVLYNSLTTSTIASPGALMQQFTAPKSYSLPLTRINGIGDRFIVEMVGYLIMYDFGTLDQAFVTFDGQIAGGHYLPWVNMSAYYKMITALDVVAASASANNIRAYTICTYSPVNVTLSPKVVDTTAFTADLTVDYANGTSKVIAGMGIRGIVPMGTQSVNTCTQFCVKYFKKI